MNKQVRGHRARKRFGQNFLQDQNIIDKIIRSINPVSNDHIVEIGPGLGALTDELMDHCYLSLIELDRDLAQRLEERYSNKDNFELIQADALKFNFKELLTDTRPEKLRLVGNLPYNISTPLIFHILSFKEIISDMHFMLQKEVVNRMTAKPGSKTYGRLSVILQYTCETHHLFDVSPESFNPPPKVDSAIIKIVPRTYIENPVKDEILFQKLVTQSFSQRRKTIRNNLKKIVSDEQLKAANIDPESRSEAIPIESFIQLTNMIA